MYSPRLYKYRDSYVLYIFTVHAFGSVSLTHTLLVQTHIHDVSTPFLKVSSYIGTYTFNPLICGLTYYVDMSYTFITVIFWSKPMDLRLSV